MRQRKSAFRFDLHEQALGRMPVHALGCERQRRRENEVKMAWNIHTWARYTTFHVVFDVHILKPNPSNIVMNVSDSITLPVEDCRLVVESSCYEKNLTIRRRFKNFNLIQTDWWPRVIVSLHDCGWKVHLGVKSLAETDKKIRKKIVILKMYVHACSGIQWRIQRRSK